MFVINKKINPALTASRPNIYQVLSTADLSSLPPGEYKFQYAAEYPFIAVYYVNGPNVRLRYTTGYTTGQRAANAPDRAKPSIFDPPKTAPQGAAGVFAIATSQWEKNF